MTSSEAKPGSGADRTRLPLLLVLGFGVFVVAAFAVALAMNGDGDSSDGGVPDASQTGGAVDDGPQPEVSAVEVIGDSLAAMPQTGPVTDASTDPAVGTVAPAVTGTDFAGRSVTIEGDGTPKVVMFLAHWCPHCQRELPLVVDLIEEGKLPDGLEIYAVSTAVAEGQPNYPPSAWFADENWTGLALRDSAAADALLAYGGGGFPFVVYLDGDNTVLARSAGELEADTIEQLWLATAQS
jgi:cytochrome c biogenesis protein CcmG, thiol:disulfide interchange protein DsbE